MDVIILTHALLDVIFTLALLEIIITHTYCMT